MSNPDYEQMEIYDMELADKDNRIKELEAELDKSVPFETHHKMCMYYEELKAELKLCGEALKPLSIQTMEHMVIHQKDIDDAVSVLNRPLMRKVME